jgi:DNA-binding MurR/RpiR family transcriptional regulator
MDIRDLIDNRYSEFTRTEKKIANFIGADGGDTIINMTLLELSKQLKTGEASIIRFCRKMGYDGFQDMKLAMAIEKAQDEEEEYSVPDNTRTMEKMTGVIKNTAANVSEQSIEKAVSMLSHDDELYFYGVGTSGIAAELAETRFLRTGRRCKAVVDSHLQSIQSAIMGEHDLIVAISVSGTTADLYGPLLTAKNNGCRIVAITNHENSRIAELSDCVILTSAPENPVTGGTFESIVSQIYVLDLLYECYVTENHEFVAGYRDKVAISINEKIHL